MAVPVPAICHTALIEGVEKTGKTAELVARVAAALTETPAADMVVFAASPDAAVTLKARLVAACPAAADVLVTTPAQYALKVLDCPGAVERYGREPRVLSRFEQSFLMEDLKVCGIDPKRIGGMLNFFRKGWSDMSYVDEGWLMFVEERELHELVQKTLGAYGAYFPEEICGAAAMLAAEDAEAEPMKFAQVFVDDMTYMSHGAQVLARVLAREGLTVTANTAASCPVLTVYPYREGVDELLADYPASERLSLASSALPETLTAALDRLQQLSADTYYDAAPLEEDAVGEGFAVVSAEDPAAECAAVTAWVQERLAAGAQPEEIAVVCSNGTWARNVLRSLSGAGIAVRSSADAGDIGGDIRYWDLSEAAKCATLLTLLADPTDASALRAWCGLGEYLTNRSLFTEVLPKVTDTGLSMADVLEALRLQGTEGSLAESGIFYTNEGDDVVQRLNTLAALRESLADARGMAVLDGIAEAVLGKGKTARDLPRAFATLMTVVPEDADAAQLNAAARAALSFPTIRRTPAVAVVSPERAFGLGATNVAVTGMVNGFSPAHAYFDRVKTSWERARTLLSRAADRMRPAVSLGEDAFVAFYFDRLRAVEAEQQRIAVSRFFFDAGTRYARTGRSLVLDCMCGRYVEKVE